MHNITDSPNEQILHEKKWHDGKRKQKVVKGEQKLLLMGLTACGGLMHLVCSCDDI